MNALSTQQGVTRTNLLLIIALLCSLGALIFRDDLLAMIRPSTASSPTAQTPAQPEQMNFDSEADKLVGRIPSFESTYKQQQSTVEAIRRGDFTSADHALRSVLAKSQLHHRWHFSPFNTYIAAVTILNDAAYLQRVNEWITQDSHSAMPYLIRALYHKYTGWAIRGNGYASNVPNEAMAQFQTHLDQAEMDAAKAISLEPSNPYASFLWLAILADHGNSDRLDAAFKQTINRFPDYYELYRQRLTSLTPKWGGSVEQMYDFVYSYADSGDPALKMLYLQLYANLIDVAHRGCHARNAGNRFDECMRALMQELVKRGLENHVEAALHAYTKENLYAYTQKLGEVLGGMIDTHGSAPFAGPVLQLAADALGSDNQLVSPDTSHNNYMMDSLAARVWYRQARPTNAITLYRRAVTDLDHMSFPDTESRVMAHVSIYDQMAQVYDGTNESRKAIVYEDAADKLAGYTRPRWGLYRCKALIHLKHYEAAAKDCEKQFKEGGRSDTAFWLGEAYRGLKQVKKADKAYRTVAAMTHYGYSADAIINLSVLYGDLHRYNDQLKLLNEYSFLYDVKTQPRDSISIAYNNRCFAKMKLGQLEAALEDCTASLHYGNLPDAYRKQQQLVKLLAAKNKAK